MAIEIIPSSPVKTISERYKNQRKKVLVTILAYNEETNICNVIERVRRVVPDATITVINDGSRDDTAKVAKQAGAQVIDLPFNLGIGGAMQTGLKMAIVEGFDYVVRMDGDGQHPPEGIPALLEPVMSGEVDIAVATRFANKYSSYRPSFTRKIGIFVFSKLATMFSGRKVSDATCSYQAMNLRAAKFLNNNMEEDHPEVDGWILLGRAGFKVKEIPMAIQPRRFGVSSINTMRAIYFIIKVSLTAFAARSRRFVL
jgi:glycosyltransferase involved in cell wall biosynthesis